MLIYCNLKNDRARAGDSAAGARERNLFLFCGELGCSLRPHPAPLLGHPSPGVSNVDRLLPGAACLPQGLKRPAFIKSLEASEGRRCVGRYVNQPGGGGASMILGRASGVTMGATAEGLS